MSESTTLPAPRRRTATVVAVIAAALLAVVMFAGQAPAQTDTPTRAEFDALETKLDSWAAVFSREVDGTCGNVLAADPPDPPETDCRLDALDDALDELADRVFLEAQLAHGWPFDLPEHWYVNDGHYRQVTLGTSAPMPEPLTVAFPSDVPGITFSPSSCTIAAHTQQSCTITITSVADADSDRDAHAVPLTVTAFGVGPIENVWTRWILVHE